MKDRVPVLDGWRGISILLVLAGHLLPLGPKSWPWNSAIVATGLAIFFVLSGFLITTIFMRDQNIPAFLIRRLMRIIPLLVLSAHPLGGFAAYFRPYLALLLVGSTLSVADGTLWRKWLTSSPLVYIAGISYALYVFHGVLRHTWLGDGDTFERYAKRPLLFAVTFGLAHLSTFYYEKYFIQLGKRMTSNPSEAPVATE